MGYVGQGRGPNQELFWAGTKLVFKAGPAGSRRLFIPIGDYSANNGDYRVRSVGGSGSHRFDFTVPDDFNTLVSIGLVAFPAAGATGAGKDIDLDSEYGNLPLGETKNNHTESDTTSTFTIPAADVLFELDVSSVFSIGLQAGDTAGVFVDHNGIGGSIFYFAIRLVYT